MHMHNLCITYMYFPSFRNLIHKYRHLRYTCTYNSFGYNNTCIIFLNGNRNKSFTYIKLLKEKETIAKQDSNLPHLTYYAV